MPVVRHAATLLATLGLAVINPASARCQAASVSHLVLGGGPTLAGGGGLRAGLHAQLALETPLTSAALLRLGAMADGLLEGISQPSCVAGTPRCESYAQPYPAQMYSGAVEIVVPTRMRMAHVYALGGAGVHYGVGYRTLNDRYGVAGGVSIGMGISNGDAGDPGFSLEVAYHQLFGGLGQLHSLLAPSLLMRF